MSMLEIAANFRGVVHQPREWQPDIQLKEPQGERLELIEMPTSDIDKANVSNEANTRLPNWLTFFAQLTLTYPLLILGSLYTQWLLSWAVLGHPPQGSIDDPKTIDGASWMHSLTGFVLLASIPMAGSGLIFNALFIIRRRLSGNKALQRILLFLMFWLGTVFLLRLDPGQVMDWWLD